MRKYSNQRLAANLFQHRSGVVPKYAEEEVEEEVEEKWNPIQPAGGRADGTRISIIRDSISVDIPITVDVIEPPC